MLTIKSTKSGEYVESFAEYAEALKPIYKDFPLITEFITTFEEEQRHSVEHLQQSDTLNEYPPDSVIYTVMSDEMFNPLCRTLADLFIEKQAAEGMAGPSENIEQLIQGLFNGEVARQFGRQAKTIQSIDVECQSLVYQFRRTVSHSKKRQTFPKTMEVLKKIRKALAARWD